MFAACAAFLKTWRLALVAARWRSRTGKDVETLRWERWLRGEVRHLGANVHSAGFFFSVGLSEQ